MGLAPDGSPFLVRIERRFRDLLDAAPDALVIVDRSGDILLVNRQTERMFGYDRDELCGRPVETLIPERLRFTHRRHRDGYVHDARPRPMGGGLDLLGLRRDGTEFPTEISLSPVDTEEGPLVIAAIRDVTDHKRAEQERTDLLARERASRAAAEEAIRARDDVMAIVSHDLQNLLNALSLNIAVLLRTPASTPGELRMRESGEVIGRSARAMGRLLRDLLEAARIESAHLAVDARPEDLPSLVRDAVALMERLAVEKGLHLEARVDDGVGLVLCERERIEQVLHNLVGNAVHFTPAGGRVTVHAVRDGSEVRVAVSDSGPGIVEEHQPQLFERYWRGRGASRHGIGLGLFIVKSIVETHGGRIWVESSPGSGATFLFTLPVAPP